MDSCVIFCAGGFDGLVEPIRETDCILAADGGFSHVCNLGLQPNCVLGDFDSLGYTPDAARVFPVEKDDTDALLAVRHGLELGYRRFLLYGSLDGPRLDHTVANLQTLQFLADRDAVGYLIGKEQIITVVRNSRIVFPPEAEGIVSVFCLGPTATGVCLAGLKYPMENGALTSGFPLGVSNRFTGSVAAIGVADGSLLVIFDRHNGLRGIVHGNESTAPCP